MADEESYQQTLARKLMEGLEEAARRRMPSNPIDPAKGMDVTRTYGPPPIMAPQVPYTPSFNGQGFNLTLPANKGASFNAYADFKLNPLKPQDAAFNGVGLRYRWDF